MAVTANIVDLTERPDLAQHERALLQRLAHGDHEALDEIVAIHQQRISRLVYRLLGWRHDADDVVQDVFLAAIKQIGRFRRESSIGTWLAAIAIKKCRTWRKKRWVRWRWLGRQRLSEPASSAADEALVKDELAAEVRRAVQELPPADREVIVLYYLEQMSVKEMAQLLQASPNAIDVRLHRARQRLRTKLGGLIEE